MATAVNPLLARLREAMSGTAETPPKGHLTSKQWAEKWGYSDGYAGTLINKAVRLGLMAMKKYRVETSRGNYPIPHYYEI